VSNTLCNEDFWSDFTHSQFLKRIEVDGVVLNTEGVIESLELWYALLEWHLSTFEAACNLAASAGLLTLGTTAGGLTALTACTTTLALGAVGTSWCWCEFIYAHDQLFS
jgi:hypothetical protein